MTTMLKLAILGSTRGTNMLGIIAAISQNKLAASIEVVISNKMDAQILERAREHQLTTEFIDPQGLSREAYDELVSQALAHYEVDLIVLIGYMRILSRSFVEQWHHRIINVHPSLLPAFAGKMDLAVHQDVLQSGVTESGCTVHYVTEVVDGGPIVVQKTCPVLPQDTPETLKARVQALEADALIEAIALLAVAAILLP